MEIVEIVVISVHLLSAFFLLAVGYKRPKQAPFTSTPYEIEGSEGARPIGLATKKVEAKNVRQFFENYSQSLAVNIEGVGVCITPHTGLFSSCTQGLCGYLQRQYLSVDYHAFVIVESSDGMWWAVDKMKDGIYMSCGESMDCVFYFDGVKRPEPVLMLIEDKSTSSLDVMVYWLRRKLPQNTHNPLDSQCQHFAKEFFNTFAKSKKWELDTNTDLINPLNLPSKVGSNGLLRLLGFVIVYYDGYLLYNESTEDEVNHYQYIGYLVILGSLIMMFFMGTSGKRERMCLILSLLLSFVLVVEALFQKPLGSVKRRSARYGEMCYGSYYLVFTGYVLIPLGLLSHSKKAIIAIYIVAVIYFYSEG